MISLTLPCSVVLRWRAHLESRPAGSTGGPALSGTAVAGTAVTGPRRWRATPVASVGTCLSTLSAIENRPSTPMRTSTLMPW